MRKVVEEKLAQGATQEHFGLAYDVLAPLAVLQEKPVPESRDQWLRGLANIEVSGDYEHGYAVWSKSLANPKVVSSSDLPVTYGFEATLLSRMLIGHGNPSPVEVGLSVHHTWGTPFVPGSAIKGLLASYIQATYGPTDLELAPNDAAHLEKTRAPFQGVSWDGNRIKHGPGDAYQTIFGAPASSSGKDSQGFVVFHDAMMLPKGDKRPFQEDVLTVHQKRYYSGAGEHWPNDWDDPNPVQFMTVKRGVSFLFAVTGPSRWAEWVAEQLKQALSQWGIGGKTVAGYGRFQVDEDVFVPPKPLRSVATWLEEDHRDVVHGDETTQLAWLERVSTGQQGSPSDVDDRDLRAELLRAFEDALREAADLGEPEVETFRRDLVSHRAAKPPKGDKKGLRKWANRQRALEDKIEQAENVRGKAQSRAERVRRIASWLRDDKA